jgi:hypothetical protein
MRVGRDKRYEAALVEVIHASGAAKTRAQVEAKKQFTRFDKSCCFFGASSCCADMSTEEKAPDVDFKEFLNLMVQWGQSNQPQEIGAAFEELALALTDLDNESKLDDNDTLLDRVVGIPAAAFQASLLRAFCKSTF